MMISLKAFKANILSLLIVGCISSAVAASILTTDNPLGKRADEIAIFLENIPEPQLSRSKKSYLTENNFGFDVFNSKSNWVVDAFLENIKPGMLVMDVGAGFGVLSREALSKKATVISNDISDNQLLYNLKHVAKHDQNRLYLNNQDIRKMQLAKNSVDLIMFHRIFHFFKGKDIEDVLTRAYLWLKPGGKIYIVMMSKDHAVFRDKIQYDTNKEWPGEDLLIVEQHLPDQAYALPARLHVTSVETLQTQLEKIGFKVEKSDYVSLKHVGIESERDGKEAVGIIATK